MRPLAARLTYGSKSRSIIQRKSSITKSRLHLSNLRNLTLSAAVSDSWIGIAIEWRKHDEIEIAFAYHNRWHHSGHVVHRLQIPQTYEVMPNSFVNPFSVPSGDAGSFVCDHILEAVKYFQMSHESKYHGAGLSEEVVRLSPQLPSRLWLDLDIVPITTTSSEQVAWSTSSGRSSVSMLSVSSDTSD